MPTAVDLVTDLPADFEVFGQAVATSLADLLGGTTGQVLKKNSNTDMDFVWSADAAGMTNPMTTTGDTIYSSSGSTPARLGIGSSGQVLTVSAGIPSWATPSGISYTFTSYTPTILATSGTITSTTAKGQYLQIGKMMFVMIDVEITNAGSGAGGLNVSIPVSAVNGNVNGRYTGMGQERAATGKQCSGTIQAPENPDISLWRFYDFTTAIATGNIIRGTIIYEVA
jgi:hypothetical protein